MLPAQPKAEVEEEEEEVEAGEVEVVAKGKAKEEEGSFFYDLLLALVTLGRVCFNVA